MDAGLVFTKGNRQGIPGYISTRIEVCTFDI